MAHTYMIWGPPGTGKTHTLVEYAGKCAAKRETTCFLSYTKAAAGEAVSRLKEAGHAINGSTIHSLAFQALNMTRDQVISFTRKQEFANATGISFRTGSIEDAEPQEGDDYSSVLSYANNRMIEPLEAYDIQGRPGQLKRFEMFVKAWNDWKKTYGYMDFDDMLISCLDTAVDLPTYANILLDEAQDCSPLQWAVIRKLSATAKRVYVAGDDDQAIYEWNGADPHGMKKFADDTDAKNRVLDVSIRVPRTAHKLAHDMALAYIDKRVEKLFRPADRDGSVEQYGGIYNYDFRTMAKSGGLILVRDRFRSLEIQKILNADAIPYKINGGQSPWQGFRAEALRGISTFLQGTAPNPEQKEAMRKMATSEAFVAFMENNKAWFKGKRPSRLLKPMPHGAADFYDMVDVDKPINLILSTVHQAKGHEHHNTMIDLTLSAKSLEQMSANPSAEARILYVALTRTSDKMALCGSNPLL